MSEKNPPKEVFTIVEAKNLDRPLFRRIGNAFVNKDGSYNVLLDALPVNGTMHIRDPKPKDKDKSEAA